MTTTSTVHRAKKFRTAVIASLAVILTYLLYHTSTNRRIASPSSPARRGDDDDDDRDDYLDDGDLVDDDRISLMMRIENEIIAPSRLKGTKALSPGTLLVSTQFRGFFADGATVLLTEMGPEIYVGYVINKPLPKVEVDAALKALRVNTRNTPALDESFRERVFFGSGGPVVETETEMWVPIHNRTQITGGIRLHEGEVGDLTVYGEITELLAASEPRPVFLLLYGRTQWLSGMLEKEIEDGYWIVTKLVRDLSDIYPVRKSYFADSDNA